MLIPFIAAIALSLSSAIAGPSPCVAAELPAIKKDCATCHQSERGAAGGRLVQELSALCLGCHPERGGEKEHRVDIVSPRAVPGLPLKDGRITCITCHDPHSNARGNLLRQDPRTLCRSCHEK